MTELIFTRDARTGERLIKDVGEPTADFFARPRYH